MAELYATKTRLRLLGQVLSQQVHGEVSTVDEGAVWLYPHAPTTFTYRDRVTARARELERAGWVYEDDVLKTWHVTDAGRAVLEGGPR